MRDGDGVFRTMRGHIGVPDDIAWNKSLSIGTIGLYVRITTLSLEQNGDFTYEFLLSQVEEDKKVLDRAIEELFELGYFTKDEDITD